MTRIASSPLFGGTLAAFDGATIDLGVNRHGHGQFLSSLGRTG
jgi:hypothetical protein